VARAVEVGDMFESRDVKMGTRQSGFTALLVAGHSEWFSPIGLRAKEFGRPRRGFLKSRMVSYAVTGTPQTCRYGRMIRCSIGVPRALGAGRSDPRPDKWSPHGRQLGRSRKITTAQYGIATRQKRNASSFLGDGHAPKSRATAKCTGM